MLNQMPDTIEQKQSEPHFLASDIVHDVVIGMSDGLTVPFAIAAGMSGAVSNATIIVTAGLAEIAAGSISMGLGGYLSGRSDSEHYEIEREREERETRDVPKLETEEVVDILRSFGLEDEQARTVTDVIRQDRDKWVDFMMRFELGLEEPDPRQALRSALTIGLSYAIAGSIPLAPYILLQSVTNALYVSVALTLLALLVFGYTKGRVTGVNALRSALQTALIGGLAAGVAFEIARLVS
jgi:predicted membrane protein (TIGR00267 family)